MSIEKEIDEYMKGCKEGTNYLPREQKQVEVMLLVLRHISNPTRNAIDRLLCEKVVNIIDNWEREIGLKKFKITLKINERQSEYELWATDIKAAIEQAKKSVCTFHEYEISVVEA